MIHRRQFGLLKCEDFLRDVSKQRSRPAPTCKLQPRDCPAPICRPEASRFPCRHSRIGAGKSRGLRPADRGRAIARPEACRSGSAGLRPRDFRLQICKLPASQKCPAGKSARPQASRFPCRASRIGAGKSRGLRPADRGKAIARPEACRSRSAGLRPRDFPPQICKLQARDCPAPICRPQATRFPCRPRGSEQGNREAGREIPRPEASRCPCPVLQAQAPDSSELSGSHRARPDWRPLESNLVVSSPAASFVPLVSCPNK